MGQPIQLVPRQCFLQISQYRSLKSKKIKKQYPFIFKFCFWQDFPHPVNWSPTHSTGPQTVFFSDISASVAQIKKIQKTRSIYFLILLLAGLSSPSQLVPNPFNWSPNSVFSDISVSVAQMEKIQKTRSIYFLILLLAGLCSASQLVPNPFNWSPTHSTGPQTVFFQISQYRSPC